jgi:hypothetical protein
MSQTNLVILIAILVVALAVIGFLAYREWNTRRLKSRFGAEYARAIETHGKPSEAEAELSEREKRARQLEIRPVSPTDRARFVDSWRAIQARFVDDPGRGGGGGARPPRAGV